MTTTPTDLNLLNLIPRGYELVLRREGEGHGLRWTATARSIKAGLEGGSCREYQGKGPSVSKAVLSLLDLMGKGKEPGVKAEAEPVPAAPPKKILSADQQERARKIGNLAIQLVGGQVEKGTLDPQDDAAMEKASKQAVRDAAATLNAVEEYLGG